MAESISEGTLKTWLKQVGDTVQADEEVATIETDKVCMLVLANISLPEYVFSSRDTKSDIRSTVATLRYLYLYMRFSRAFMNPPCLTAYAATPSNCPNWETSGS